MKSKHKYGYIIYGMKYNNMYYIGYIPINNKNYLIQYEKWNEIPQQDRIKNKKLYKLLIENTFEKCSKLLEYQIKYQGMDPKYYKGLIEDCCIFYLFEITNEEKLKENIKKYIRKYSSVSNGYNNEEDNDYENDSEKEEGDYVVYKHTSPNGKSYIGITNNVKKRWEQKGEKYKGCTKFYNAIKKYGWDNFTHEILEENISKGYAFNREKYYIEKFDTIKNGYNISKGGKDTNFLKKGIDSNYLQKLLE